MGEVGLLNEDSRVELIDGEIVQKELPISSQHAGAVRHLIVLMHRDLPAKGKYIVSVHNPVVLNEYNEPEPDLALLRWRDNFYVDAHPGPQDVLLIIEISDSTLRYDRDVKIPLYAKNGIPEVWLLDIQNRQLEIYREPINGIYRQRDCRHAGQIAPVLCPDAVIDLAELFPNPGATVLRDG
ncbi:MAG: Uma2 family endonuclease [Candidatus Contendobacter sp.]|nr:Uma2 family endonuclease [Candidatus Contendobacter sp.]MDS4057638.1 Uma2 family endonuclease [Candidatus Contendobacter sp.]